MNNLIDTHVHLWDFQQPEKVILELIKRRQYTLSMTNSPEEFIYLKKKFDSNQSKYIRFALGYHPQTAGRYKFNTLLFTKYFPKTKYIGEVGLDFSKEYVQFSKEQIKVFTYICKMSGRNEKILSIHCFKAEEEVLNILKEHGIKKAIIHWYSGNTEVAERMVEAGYYFSINERMIHSNKGKELFEILPQNRILIETDAPYTINNSDTYYSQVEKVYCSINSKGISKEQVFMNFTELLGNLQEDDDLD